jgi:hypothetical protein
MNRRGLAVLLVVGALLAPDRAQAAEPTKEECIAADDAVQMLRRAGKLLEARDKVSVCVAMSCPGVVREDCGQRLAEIERVMPTIVFEPKDGAGNDVSEVTVTMDGRRLADRVLGMPLQVDPGEHRFVFEGQGLPTAEKTLVVHEGEQGRRERVVLGLAPSVPPPSAEPPTSPPPPPPASDGSSQRTIALAGGGVGVVALVVGSVLGLVAKSTYDHALQTECGNNWSSCSPQGLQDGRSAHGQAAASTVAFVAGAALLGAGAVLYIVSPKAGVSVGANVGTERAALVVARAW